MLPALGPSDHRFAVPKFVPDEFVELAEFFFLCLTAIKKGPPFGEPLFMAVGQRFELWEPRGSTVFKTAAFDHSATPPEGGKLYIGLTQEQVINLCF